MSGESQAKEVTLLEAKLLLRSWWKYLLSKWLWIGIFGIAVGIIGIFYAASQKTIYTAELTFAADADPNGLGSMAGLASQFGFDVGGNSGAFEGDNLIILLKSRRLIDKTFLTPVVIDGKKQLLVEYFISTKNGNKKGTPTAKIIFEENQMPGNRRRDSVMKAFFTEMMASISIGRIDRKSDIILASLKSEDETFAQVFIEQLANNAIQYYKDFKTSKSTQNVAILQRQTDSVRRLITGGIVSIAQSNDLNINPMKQVMKTGVQRKGVDLQVNTTLYQELVKNLQLSRMAMRTETPFIQIIDTPILPLDKKKMGRAKAGVLFGMMGLFLATLFFALKRLIKQI